MRKNVFGRRFKRDINERKALFKSLISSLVLHERIKTTQEKAKSIKGQVDKVVNKAKQDRPNKLSLLYKNVSADAAEKLVKDIAHRFNTKTSGYTRLIRTGHRLSDGASMVIMEWVEKDNENRKLKIEDRGDEKKVKKTEKVKDKKRKPRKRIKKEVKE